MTDAPERIWADRGPCGGWVFRSERMPDSQHEYTRADLAATVRVKPLVWRHRTDISYLHEAKGADEWYRNIREDDGQYILEGDFTGNVAERIFPTLEAAKAAAQADYEARILAALERSDPRVAALVEKAFWLGRSCGGSASEIEAGLAALATLEAKV